jgi:drug/metabolite transporter (DMT)-like permease
MVAYSFTSLLLRSLGNRDATVTIVFWFVSIVGVVSGVLAYPDWSPILREHWLYIAILALSGTFGQILLTAAFRRASVAIVAPLDYTHMIWAVLYGLVLWGYLPGWRVWVGSGIIVLSGIFILFRENHQRKKLARILDGQAT